MALLLLLSAVDAENLHCGQGFSGVPFNQRLLKEVLAQSGMRIARRFTV
ncbi:hypothetical protein [Kosakonia sacchari]|nr:hypothetical protein [Kosakonia sacchari]